MCLVVVHTPRMYGTPFCSQPFRKGSLSLWLLIYFYSSILSCIKLLGDNLASMIFLASYLGIIWLKLQYPVYALNWNPREQTKKEWIFFALEWSAEGSSESMFMSAFHLILTPPLLFCVLDFPANNIVKFLVGFTNKGTEDFIVESLDASFRYPQDYQFYIQNFTALPLNTIVPPQRQATFEYSFIPAEPMGGRPFGLVINLNYKDLNVRPLSCVLFC